MEFLRGIEISGNQVGAPCPWRTCRIMIKTLVVNVTPHGWIDRCGGPALLVTVTTIGYCM